MNERSQGTFSENRKNTESGNFMEFLGEWIWDDCEVPIGGNPSVFVWAHQFFPGTRGLSQAERRSLTSERITVESPRGLKVKPGRVSSDLDTDNRRKFRSQTSDNMVRWKSRGEKSPGGEGKK